MSEPHHYIECGLLNVYIEGILIEIDDDSDEVITIPRVNQLHKVIAFGIVSHPKGMSGEELRFLRSEMGMTQAELATTVHRDKQSIGRWERGEIELESAAEVVVRRLAIEKLGLPDISIEDLSRQSVATAEIQPINISANDEGREGYELLKAA